MLPTCAPRSLGREQPCANSQHGACRMESLECVMGASLSLLSELGQHVSTSYGLQPRPHRFDRSS